VKIITNTPSVEKILLFGSAATGRATPASDVDIIIIVTTCENRFIDRAADFIDYFSEIDLSVDIFVYTKDEIAVDPPPIFRTAVKTGIVLAEKKQPTAPPSHT
jgi:predicted nucleotidyltransferase